MKDSEHQEGQTGPFPVSKLTRRLLRRATEPIGVINVRHAAELHSRSSLFLSPKREFVANLKTRYGVGESKGASTALGAPLQRMTDPIPLSPGSPSPWGENTGIAGTARGKAPTTPPQEYRVRRPNSYFESDPFQMLVSEIPAPLSHTAGEIPTPSRTKADADHAPIHIQRKTGELPPLVGPANSSPMPLVVPASSSHPEIRPGGQDVAGEIHRSSAIRDSKPPKSTQEDSLTSTRANSGSAARLPEISEKPLLGSALQMHLQRMPERSAVAEKVGGVSGVDDLRSGSTSQNSSHRDASGSNSVLNDAFPQAREVPRAATRLEMHLQRRAAAAEELAALPQANTELRGRNAVASEIRVASPPVFTSIVWRKADSNGTRRESGAATPAATVTPTYTNGYQIMRQSSSDSVSAAAALPETPDSPGGGVEITRIAEHVSRIIARQLTIERERRGSTR